MRCLVSTVVLFALALAAHAQTYPSKPVRFIIPQSPGGQVDVVGRSVAQFFSERMGQPFVVDNRAGANGAIGFRGGANGAIGFEAGAKAPPDGYTLLMANQSGLVFAPILKKTLPYDSLADFS